MRFGQVIIENVSSSMLSVARHYGGCTFNGREYRYDPAADRLVRSNWWCVYQKTPFNAFLDAVLTYDTANDAKRALRAQKAAKTANIQSNQTSLFDL